jgi:uncharacterized protein YndB with AHSA1/START domain
MQAQATTQTFRQSCTVQCNIKAPPAQVWALLTDAARFPSWNSTVTKIEGTIALGQVLEVKVPADPKRTFKPKVTRFEEQKDGGEKMMEWSDGFAPMFRGVRTFTLTPTETGTAFTMTEVFSGVMLPMIRGSLPDFAPIFEAYAKDLARAAEGGAS